MKKLFFLTIFTVIILFPQSVFADWLTGWSYRKQITIQNAYIDSNLSYFPVYIKISSDSDMSSALTTGYDIRFTDNNGTTLLTYERESWSGGGGNAVTADFWVNVPNLYTSPTGDQNKIYIYYGKADAPDGADPINVWDGNTKARWSMKDLTTSTIEDSTINNKDGNKKAANEPIESDAKIGKGQNFDGVDDYVNVGNIGTPTAYTAEAWVKIDKLSGGNSDQTTYGFTMMATSSSYALWLSVGKGGGTEVTLRAFSSSVTGYNTTGANLNTTDWFHIVAVATKNSTAKVYVNSVEKLSFTADDIAWAGNFTIGDLRPDRYICFDGLIDEVRISDIVRPADWIKFEYRNMSESDNELTWGSKSINPLGITIPVNSKIDVNGSCLLNVPGNITINGTLEGASSGTISLTGNWTNAGTFTCGAGRVMFNGTSAQIVTTGSSDWSNIEVTNSSTEGVTFADGFTTTNFTDETPSSRLNFRYQETDDTLYEFTAFGGLILDGGSVDTRIVLRRYGGSGSDQWEIYPSGGGWYVNCVDVLDSVNSASSYINPTDSITNPDNNTNWFSPTYVGLVSFNAIGYFGKVKVKWKTDIELKNAGFNIYRSQHPKKGYVKINSNLIPGLGSSVVGKDYEFWDYGVTNGVIYYYKLEDVEFNGRATMHGPVVAHPGLDSDGDGMTDDWENYYGLNPNDASDASLDLDGDGFTNLEEFIQGTDPTVSETPPESSLEDGLKIIRSDDYGVILELITSSFEVENKTIEDEIYQVIKLLYSHGQTTEVGKPQVPVKGVVLGIPFDSSPPAAKRAGITVNAISEEEEVFPGYELPPAPRIELKKKFSKQMLGGGKILDELSYEFVKDGDAYSQDEFYPDCLAKVSSGGGSLRGQDVAKLNIYPIQFEPVTGELKLHKKIRIEVDFGKKAEIDGGGIGKPSSQFNRLYKNLFPNYENVKQWKRRPRGYLKSLKSITQSAYKILVSEEGIHRLTWQDLSDAGLNPSLLEPRRIKLYNQDPLEMKFLTGQGEEIPIYVAGEADGSFDYDDYIEFYAEALDTRYTSTNVYWLITGGGQGVRMEVKSPVGEGDNPTNFLSICHYEEDESYWQDIADKGYVDDHWFFDDTLLAPSSVNFTVSLSDVALVDGDAMIEIALQGYSYYDLIEPDHHTIIYLNGHKIDDTTWDGNIEYIREVSVPQDYLIEGDNTITVELPGDTGADVDWILANWFEISYWRAFKAEENALNFNNQEQGLYTYKISDFTENDIGLFDITNPKEVKRIVYFDIEEELDGTYTVSFNDSLKDASNRDYIVLSSSNIKSPVSIVEYEPANLRSKTNRADYIIITHEDFYDGILSLAEHRQAQGLCVKVVKVGDIYDEFNYGIFSPQAIKDFLEYAYSEWTEPTPTFVLLVGDGTYDYKDNEGLGCKNYVPTYMIHSPEFGETGYDSWFVCLEGEDDVLPDMFIGRLPVYSVEQVNTIVDKIINYETSPSDDWTKKVTLVADNLEGTFVRMSDSLTDYVSGEYQTNKIYLDDYSNPIDCKQDIIDAINQGTLILNYVGHGSVITWAHESILTIPDIPSLTNLARLPFIATITCGNGYFINPPGSFNCIAEELLYSSSGGAVAIMAPTAVSYTEFQKWLDEGIFESIFVNNNFYLGVVIAEGMLNVFENAGESGETVIQTFPLFGDPALELKILSDDKLPPTVVSVYPSAGDTNVGVSSNIMVEFSEPMNSITTFNAFSISPHVTGSITWDGNTLIFEPDSDLSPDREYTVTVDIRARDLAGNKLDGNGNGISEGSPVDDYQWSFTTFSVYGGGGGGGGGDGCFIATACFGTPMADEIKVLNRFRDECLLTNPIGKVFVNTYYKVSPPVADFIRKHSILKSVVRETLRPLIWVAKECEKR